MRYDEQSTTRRIFKEGPNSGQVTIGTTVYGVPANMAVEIKPENDGVTKVFSDRQLVQDYFSGKAGITASGFGFTGHFDASYSQVSTSDKSYHYSLVDAWNEAGFVKLREQGSDWFTSDFKDELNALPATFKGNEDEFFAFYDIYGTHFVHQVKLGGSIYYYVAVEKSFESNETKVQTHLELEYKGIFARTKAEADANWQKLGKQWSESRVVRLRTQGGNSSLDLLSPAFGDWKGEAFKAWSDSLANKPGQTGFNLRPISTVATAKRKKAMDEALAAYLSGGMVVKADRVATPQSPQRAFTSSATIIGPEGVVKMTPDLPVPVTRDVDVEGVQVVLFDPDTLKVIFNKAYYVNPENIPNVGKMWVDLHRDVSAVPQSKYLCAVSVFGLSPIFYPPNEVTGWLTSCGAKLTEWKKYIGATSSASGKMCYTLAGSKGARGGATEDFVFDLTHRVANLNATSLFFQHGRGLRAAKAAK